MSRIKQETARERLTAWRGKRTLKACERLINIDANTLGKIEAGRYVPGEALKYRLHAATGIEVSAWPAREKGRAA
jgi:transcriptional regulator with XRE-family HTH domain